MGQGGTTSVCTDGLGEMDKNADIMPQASNDTGH